MFKTQNINMKKVSILFSLLLLTQLTYSQKEIVASVVTKYEDKLIKIVSDTIPASSYYNLTGNESVGDVVLNVIFIFNDGRESNKEFEVIEYKRSNSITEVLVNADDGQLKYFFIHDQNIIITRNIDGEILWEGDIIF